MYEYQAIDRASAELSKLLLRELPLASILTSIRQLAVAAIPSCDEAGVTVEEQGNTVLRLTPDETAKCVDDYQYNINEGPCLEASRTRSTVLVENLATDSKWPRFSSFAASAGVASSLSIPLISGSDMVGVLSLYSTDEAFGPSDETLGLLFAQEAAGAIRHARTSAKTKDLIYNLQRALESRSVIGAAVGIMMHRDNLSMATAFDKLVQISQENNVKLYEVAKRITAGYEDPEGPLASVNQGLSFSD